MAFALLGCGSTPRVTRVYDGRVVEERYIAPEAYAAFLRGALAEESGDFRSAIDAYREAEDEDEVDPEIATRLGEVRCRVDPRDPEIDRAFARAMKRDPGSASALAAAGRCALSRGRAAEAAELARRAAELDPSNVTLIAFAARTRAVEGDPAGRAQVVALTEAHGEIAAAWDAPGATPGRMPCWWRVVWRVSCVRRRREAVRSRAAR
jgi:tetratricopeptide (TPR) repeat protein